MPPLSDFTKDQLIEIMVDQVKKTDQAWSDRTNELLKVIWEARENVFQMGIIVRETMNPTSIIGADIYRRIQETHALLHEALKDEEGRIIEKPK